LWIIIAGVILNAKMQIRIRLKVLRDMVLKVFKICYIVAKTRTLCSKIRTTYNINLVDKGIENLL